MRTNSGHHRAQPDCSGLAPWARAPYPLAHRSRRSTQADTAETDASRRTRKAESASARASTVGTRRFHARTTDELAEEFQQPFPRKLTVSALGIGSYLGECTDEEDARYRASIRAALAAGVNVLDTASNYRCQRSERAMGQAIRGHHVARGTRSGSYVVLDADTDAGRAYAGDVAWARRYADANRRAMAEHVVGLMGRLFAIRAIEADAITCDHNHVARELHLGEEVWVHRKGAMPATDGAAGVVPGSMGTGSYHVIGRGCAEALRSSAHGAGRRMSRESARQQFSSRELCRQTKGVWFDPRSADQLRDEAPRAYKDVRGVIRASHELVRVTRLLRPLLTYKGT